MFLKSLRATILASIDEPGEVEAAEAWLASARERLTYVSEQLGCGCCVLMWDIEGEKGVIESVPEHLRCSSDWAQPDGKI